MMAAKNIKVPQNAHYEDSELELKLPDSWQVEVKEMAGDSLPPLTADQMRAILAKPIGSPTIRELARGKKEVCIVFDDMSRPTRCGEIADLVLEELAEAGIKDNQIRFICAVGTHGAHSLVQFSRKLGTEIPARFPVYNHNPYENCTPLGTTSRGTPVEVNSEFVNCDLRIAIGCLVPHPMSTWGGGGKIILPGVASIDTIASNHKNLVQKGPAPKGFRRPPAPENHLENELYLDIAETARMSGLEFKIDALVNTRRQTVDMVCGDFFEAQQVGIEKARKVYATERAEDADVAIINGYSKANEAMLATGWQIHTVTGNPLDVVLLTSCPEGTVVHYLYGGFGKQMGGRGWTPRLGLPIQARRFIFVNPYMDRACYHQYGDPDQIIWARSWEQARAMLKEWHPDGARAVVYPDRTIQKLV
ncbi:MAG: lactate racemase domain-containing protein [Chloroflexi bacterium]|nr:lactate racemase domain-containing protein [Chloroflexota bacterium]